MGLGHKEFDVSLQVMTPVQDKIVFYNNETLLLSKAENSNKKDSNQPRSSLIEHFDVTVCNKLLSDKNIEYACKKGGGWDSMNTNYYLPKKEN